MSIKNIEILSNYINNNNSHNYTQLETKKAFKNIIKNLDQTGGFNNVTFGENIKIGNNVKIDDNVTINSGIKIDSNKNIESDKKDTTFSLTGMFNSIYEKIMGGPVEDELIKLDSRFKLYVDDSLKILSTPNMYSLVQENFKPDSNPNINSLSLKIPRDIDNKHSGSDNIWKDKKELYDVMTDYVVTDVIKTVSNKINIVSTVITTFEYLIEQYSANNGIEKEKIHILYKGGNVIRLLSYESIKYFSLDIERILFDEYSDFFKSSDHDFEFKIDKAGLSVDQFNKMYNELSFLIFSVLSKIAEFFNVSIDDQPNKFFSLYEYKDDYIKTKLASVTKIIEEKIKNKQQNETYTFKNLVKINALMASKNIFHLNSIKLPDSTPLNLGNDKEDIINSNARSNSSNERTSFMILDGDKVYIDTSGNIVKNLHIIPYKHFKNKIANVFDNEKNSGYFYAQYNNALEFKSDSGDLNKFNLCRIKYNFRMYFDWLDNGEITQKFINIPGEIIDISIAHIDQYKHAIFTKEHIGEYILKSDEGSFKFTSYTIKGFILDLYLLLFVEKNKPWDDVKYIKRIRRIFLFYLIDLLIDKDSGGGSINDQLKIVLNLIKLLNSPITTNFMNELETIQNIKNYEMYSTFKQLFKIKQHSLNEEDKFNEFIDVIKNELNTMKIVINKIVVYVNNEGVVNKKLLRELSKDGFL
jgi:hypothetical protein